MNRAMSAVTFVFAGDFRLTLPVIPRRTLADIIKAGLKSSHLWSPIQTLTLRTNMRAHLGGGDSSILSQLLQVHDEKVSEKDGLIKIGEELGRTVTSLDELISKIYPDIEKILEKDYTWICERAIVSAMNSSIDYINAEILMKVPGDEKINKSIDTVIDTEDKGHYPNNFSIPSIHQDFRLKIKVEIKLF